MKTIGIISEYNPFHKGHQYQLEQVHMKVPEATCIAIMSGAFVQRGEPAYFSKFDRARWAILSGADVVIELPTIYALGSAEIFSTGAVRLLKALHIDTISFGTELDDLHLLQEAAQLLNSPEGQLLIRDRIQTGTSYGSALRQVLERELEKGHLLATAPNAILGLEYVRSALHYYPKLAILPIQRQSNHHSNELTATFPSGSALRQALQANQEVIDFVPPVIADHMKQCITTGAYTNYHRYEDFLLAFYRLLEPSQLHQFADFTEGIEHRWHESTQHTSWSLVLNAIKTKRYTFARLQRMAAYGALGITKELMLKAHQEGPQYARLLAFNNKGRQWLKEKAYDAPLIQKWAPARTQISAFGQTLMKIDEKSTDLQAYTFTNEQLRAGNKDYTYSPQYITD